MDENKIPKKREKDLGTVSHACKSLHNPKGVRGKHYSVIKKHHLHGWLRQQRMLVINYTHVSNCKPAEATGASPTITKQFLLTDITSIGFKGKKTFCLHIRGDHVYYYYSPWAIEIAYDIQRYVAAANAVHMLLAPGDRCRALLMRQLIARAIPLPGAQSHSPRAARLRSNIMTALRNGTVDGSGELRELTRVWREKTVRDAMDLAELRRSLNAIRNLCAADVLRRSVLAHHDEMDTYALILESVESVLQHDVIRRNFDKIIESLRLDKSLTERQSHFDQQRLKLRGNSAEHFDVPKGLRKLHYELVLHHFEIIPTCKCPSDFLAQLVNIAACLCLTVYVATVVRKQAHSRSEKNSSGAAPVRISTTQRVGGVAADGPSHTSSCNNPNESKREEIDVKNKALARKQKKGMDASSISASPPYMDGNSPILNPPADIVGNTKKPIILSFSPSPRASLTPTRHFTNEDVSDGAAAATAEKCLSSAGSAPSSESAPESRAEDTREEGVRGLSASHISALSPDPAGGVLGRYKNCTLSADDITPLFMHLLCQSDVPDVCLLLHAVSLLHDTNGTSEADYYLTTFAAAVEMICSSATPPSTAL